MQHSTDQICDVIILGAGPAGCAAALCLSQYDGIGIRIIDRGRNSEKAGEVLPPGIDRILTYLGLDKDLLRSTRHEQHRTLSAWGSDRLQERAHVFGASGVGWALDRSAFDEALRKEVARRGIPINHAIAREFQEAYEGWHLTCTCPGNVSTLSLQTRFVVDAGGRSSRFARLLADHEKSDDRLVASWSLFNSPEQQFSPFAGATLVEAAAEGWWYSAELPNQTQAAALFTTPDILQQLNAGKAAGWKETLHRTTHMRSRLSGLQMLTGPSVFPAQPNCLRRSHGRNWAACGDAAFTADPLSSMGISMALLTGAHAARLAAETIRGGDIRACSYSAEIKRHYEEHQAQRALLYRRENRWPDSPFWRNWQTLRNPSHNVPST